MRKSAHTSSGLQEADGLSAKRLISAVVRKSLQSNLIKAVVCVLAQLSTLALFLFLFLCEFV